MATELKSDLPTAWNASARITAASALDVLITNHSSGVIHWAITSDDTAPTIDEARGHRISPVWSLDGSQQAVKLASGERLWYVGSIADISATITTGGAA